MTRNQTIFMNSPLSAAHATLEGDCSSCHRPWAGVAPERCLECHLPVLLGKNHAAVAQQCHTCHQEHLGRAHALTQIAPAQCLRCHQEVLTAGSHPLDTAGQCLLCHGQHTPAVFARTVTSDLIMPHSTHVRDPGPVTAACERCHLPAAEPALVQYPLEPVCSTCHSGYVHDTTQDIRADACRLCHDADRPVTLKRAAGFATLRFSHETHRAFTCRECHAEMDVMMTLEEITLPGVETCKKCH